ERRSRAPVPEVAEDLPDLSLHASPPVTLIQNDGCEHLARPAGIVVDDNVVIPIVTHHLPHGHGETAGDGLLVVETSPVQPPLEIPVAGRHDEDAVRLRTA